MRSVFFFFFFKSSIQTTIALLDFGSENLFSDTNEPVDHVNVCAGRVVDWCKMVVSSGRSSPPPTPPTPMLHRKQQHHKTLQRLEMIWVCFSPCRAHLCYSWELCRIDQTAERSQRETKSISRIAPKMTWLSVEELSSKNNIVIVEAVETAFLSFPTTIYLSSTPKTKLQTVSWKT